jgi:NAD(P)-dependent dehydrogenase (short-subunit alcohol dehydrogenase family)
MSLCDKRILVIGGSSGIGFAIAKAAAEKKAFVTIASRSVDKLKAAKSKIGNNTETQILDVNDESAVADFFSKTPSWDHVVLTAVTPKGGNIKALSLSEAKESFSNMFWRAYIVAKYANFTENGSLILTSGIISSKPFKNVPVIAAAAGALESFARALALDFSPVRVNVIAPGFINTPMHGDNAEEKLKSRVEKHLINRVGKPEEVALAAIYLMENQYVTGQIIHIDGGYFLS